MAVAARLDDDAVDVRALLVAARVSLLRTALAAARKSLDELGTIPPDLWEQVDRATDAMIAAMPPDAPRRGPLR
jgi:hypothetical protein